MLSVAPKNAEIYYEIVYSDEVDVVAVTDGFAVGEWRDTVEWWSIEIGIELDRILEIRVWSVIEPGECEYEWSVN